MAKRLLICFIGLVIVAGVTLAADKHTKDGSWNGWISDSHCAAKGQGADVKHGGCAESCVKNKGAKYVLLNPDDKKVYNLDPQDKAIGHAGHHVKVTGTVEGDTIKVKSLEMLGEQKGHDKK